MIRVTKYKVSLPVIGWSAIPIKHGSMYHKPSIFSAELNQLRYRLGGPSQQSGIQRGDFHGGIKSISLGISGKLGINN